MNLISFMHRYSVGRDEQNTQMSWKNKNERPIESPGKRKMHAWMLACLILVSPSRRLLIHLVPGNFNYPDCFEKRDQTFFFFIPPRQMRIGINPTPTCTAVGGFASLERTHGFKSGYPFLPRLPSSFVIDILENVHGVGCV